MKRFIVVALAVVLVVFSFASCRTIEDTKPKNDTTTPNATRII